MGTLYPDSVEANRMVYVPGQTVTLTFSVKNIGSLGVAPFYKARVRETSALLSGTLEKEWSGQMVHIPVGSIEKLVLTYTCKETANLRRDVFLLLWQDKVDGIELASSTWADAFSVIRHATKVEILDLTLS